MKFGEYQYLFKTVFLLFFIKKRRQFNVDVKKSRANLIKTFGGRTVIDFAWTFFNET